MWHPFDYLPSSWRIPVLVVLLILTVIVARKTNQPLKPFRIVALELAPNTEAAGIIMDRWKKDDPTLAAARLLQYWDNYFIICYSTLLALGCAVVADWLYSLNGIANFQGKLFAWLMWVAGVLDYGENYAINKMLDGRMESKWPKVSSLCASFKFIFLATGIMYIISGILVGLLPLHKPRE